jgi:GNAT superfamily N-acetyltransferase
VSTIPLALDGYTDLPPGKFANVVTYLEMRALPPSRPSTLRPELGLIRLKGVDVDRYLAIYRVLGERWLWWSRLEAPPETIAALLDSPDVEAYALTCRGEAAGLLELDFQDSEGAELKFFGVYEPMIGTGAATWLMDRAIEQAWRRLPRRFFVHTCTFDHPRAVDFYRRSGFVPYKFAIEVDDDPRLTGALPRTAGAHVPVIDPAAT